MIKKNKRIILSYTSCMRVEDEDLETEPPVGYQFSVKLVPDLDADSLQAFLQELRRVVVEE